MKDMKKIVVSLLCMAMLCTFTACGIYDRTNTGDESAIENDQNADTSDNEKSDTGKNEDKKDSVGKTVKDIEQDIKDDMEYSR